MMNSRWNNSSTLLSVAAISALALSSCASEDMESEEDEAQPTATVTETVEAESSETPQSDATEEAPTEAEPTEGPSSSSEADDEEGIYQAVAAVTQEYPDAVIMDLDTEGSAYEFTIFEAGSEWELDVDRESFEISNTQEDEIDADDQAYADAVEIDFAEALRTAADEVDGTPEQADLDEENGAVTWEIELDNGSEVHVDVASGDVDRVDN